MMSMRQIQRPCLCENPGESFKVRKEVNEGNNVGSEVMAMANIPAQSNEWAGWGSLMAMANITAPLAKANKNEQWSL